MASEIINTIMEQIEWRELQLAKFKFILIDDNTLRIVKASKSMEIHYDMGHDTYDIWKFKYNSRTLQQTLVGKRSNIMWDELRPSIQSHFKFEYIRGGIPRLMRNLKFR